MVLPSGGKSQVGQFAAIVLLIRSQLSRSKAGAFSDPDVALSLLIRRPSDAIDAFGRHQV